MSCSVRGRVLCDALLWTRQRKRDDYHNSIQHRITQHQTQQLFVTSSEKAAYMLLEPSLPQKLAHALFTGSGGASAEGLGNSHQGSVDLNVAGWVSWHASGLASPPK